MTNSLNIIMYKEAIRTKMIMGKIKKQSPRGVIIIICVFLNLTSFSNVKLPSIFADQMVLQQKADVAIWGLASPNKIVKITTSWDNKSYQTEANFEGKWKIKVSTHTAGGPFSIKIHGENTIILKDILIGEVWVCSGQSNMAMPMLGYFNQPVFGANQAIVTSTNESIRLFTVKKEKALELQNDFTGEWMKCIPENVANFSAVAYFFGEMLQKVLNVPVGLICSSWRGTRIEPWMSEQGIENFDWVKLPDKNRTDKFNQFTPTVLYNAMIAPMVGYSIGGCIWYQGEANRKEPEHYRKLLPGLVEDWRSNWGIGDFPFYYVQIAPFSYQQENINSSYIREAMLKAADDIPNSGMACILDAGKKDCIHPPNKKVVGERLAYLALAKAYEKRGFEYSGPVLNDVKIEGQFVKLKFDHSKNGLTTLGKKLENFELAGKNKRYFPAEALITTEGVTVFSSQVAEPIAVRYGFDDFVIGTLFNTEGLPASSFRTDNW